MKSAVTKANCGLSHVWCRTVQCVHTYCLLLLVAASTIIGAEPIRQPVLLPMEQLLKQLDQNQEWMLLPLADYRALIAATTPPKENEPGLIGARIATAHITGTLVDDRVVTVTGVLTVNAQGPGPHVCRIFVGRPARMGAITCNDRPAVVIANKSEKQKTIDVLVPGTGTHTLTLSWGVDLNDVKQKRQATLPLPLAGAVSFTIDANSAGSFSGDKFVADPAHAGRWRLVQGASAQILLQWEPGRLGQETEAVFGVEQIVQAEVVTGPSPLRWVVRLKNRRGQIPEFVVVKLPSGWKLTQAASKGIVALAEQADNTVRISLVPGTEAFAIDGIRASDAAIGLPDVMNAVYQGGQILIHSEHSVDVQMPQAWRRLNDEKQFRRYAVPGPGSGVVPKLGIEQWGIDVRSSTSVELTDASRPWTMVQSIVVSDFGRHVGDIELQVPTGWQLTGIETDQPIWIRQLAGGGELSDLSPGSVITVVPKAVNVRELNMVVRLKRIDDKVAQLTPVLVKGFRSSSHRLSILSTAPIETHITSTPPWRMDTSSTQDLPTGALRAELFATGNIAPVHVKTTYIVPDVGIESVLYLAPGLADDHWARLDMRVAVRTGEVKDMRLSAPIVLDGRLQIISDSVVRDEQADGFVVRARVPLAGDHLIRIEGTLDPKLYGNIARVGVQVGEQVIPVRQVVVVQAPPQADLVLNAGSASLALAADALPTWSRPLPGTPVSVAWRLSDGETGTYRLERRPLAQTPEGFIDQLTARTQIDNSGSLTLITARVAAVGVQALPLVVPPGMTLLQATVDGQEVAVRRVSDGTELPLPGRTQVQVALLFRSQHATRAGDVVLPLPRLGGLPATTTQWTVAVAGGWSATVVDESKAMSLSPSWDYSYRPWFGSWHEDSIENEVPVLPAVRREPMTSDARALQAQTEQAPALGEPQLVLRGHLFTGTRLGGETQVHLSLQSTESLRNWDHVGWVLAVLSAVFLAWRGTWPMRIFFSMATLLMAFALHEWKMSVGPVLALCEWLAPLTVVAMIAWYLVKHRPQITVNKAVTSMLLVGALFGLSVSNHIDAGEKKHKPKPVPTPVPTTVLMGYEKLDPAGVPQDVKVALTRAELTHLWQIKEDIEKTGHATPAVCDLATGTPRYVLEFKDGQLVGTMSLAVAVPGKEWQQVRIPVVPGSVRGLTAQSLGGVDPGTVTWTSENDGLLVLTLAPRQQADVVINLAIPLEQVAGEWKVTMPFPAISGGTLQLQTPNELVPWFGEQLMTKVGSTWSSSLTLRHERMELSLRQPPAQAVRELHLGVEQQVHVALQSDHIEWQAHLTCTTQGGALRRLHLNVPTGLVLTNVTGEDVADWKQDGDKAEVIAATEQTGTWHMKLTGIIATSSLPKAEGRVLVQVSGAERTYGRLDMTAGAGLRFDRPQSKRIERIDPRKGADQAVRWQTDPGDVVVSWRALDNTISASVRAMLSVGTDRIRVRAALDFKGPGQRDVIRLRIPLPWHIVAVSDGTQVVWQENAGQRECALRMEHPWQANTHVLIELSAERSDVGDDIQTPDLRPVDSSIPADRQMWIFAGAGDRRVRLVDSQQQQAMHISAAQKAVGDVAELMAGERWLQACSWRGDGSPKLQLEKQANVIRVRASHYLVLAQDRVRWSAHLVHMVNQGELTTLRCVLPPAARLTRVTADGLGNWTLNGQELIVTLAGPTRQNTALDLELELPLKGQQITIPALTFDGGAGPQDVALVEEDDLGLVNLAPEGLDAVLDRKAPFSCPVGVDMAAIRHRWKSVRPQWSLTIKRETLATSAGIDGVVALVDAVTVLGIDGECRGRAVWQVLNRTRTHLAVRLPPGLELWETRVGGVDVRPRQGATPQDIIIPVTPQRPGESTQPVTLTWRERLNPNGKMSPGLPQFTDLRIMQGLWRVVPPPGFTITRHSGTMLPVEEAVAEAARAQCVIDELKRLRSLGDLDDVGLRRLNDQLVTLDLQLSDNLVSLEKVDKQEEQSFQQRAYNAQVINSVSGKRQELQQELVRIDNVLSSRSQRRGKLGLDNPTQVWSKKASGPVRSDVYAPRNAVAIAPRQVNALAPDATLGAGDAPPGQRREEQRALLGLDLLGDPGAEGLALRAQGNDLYVEISMDREGTSLWPWLAALCSLLLVGAGIWLSRQR